MDASIDPNTSTMPQAVRWVRVKLLPVVLEIQEQKLVKMQLNKNISLKIILLKRGYCSTHALLESAAT